MNDSAPRGVALVTVLWVLVLLAVIAASFTKTTRTEINLTPTLLFPSDETSLRRTADRLVWVRCGR